MSPAIARRLAALFLPLALAACSGGDQERSDRDAAADAAAEAEALHTIFEDYYQAGLELNPIGATFQGVDTWNHIWPGH